MASGARSTWVGQHVLCKLEMTCLLAREALDRVVEEHRAFVALQGPYLAKRSTLVNRVGWKLALNVFVFSKTFTRHVGDH